jgi:hypothetical protein
MNRKRLVLIKSRDPVTQIIQTSPSPPAPTSHKKLNRLHDMFSAHHQEQNYKQEAELSISQKLKHRRQVPQAKLKGNHSN